MYEKTLWIDESVKLANVLMTRTKVRFPNSNRSFSAIHWKNSCAIKELKYCQHAKTDNYLVVWPVSSKPR